MTGVTRLALILAVALLAGLAGLAGLGLTGLAGLPGRNSESRESPPAPGGPWSRLARIPAASHRAGARRLYVSPSGSDGARCTRRAPCRGLERADELARPGTTVRVAPGTYAPARLRASGTAARRIRFVSTKRWRAAIVNQGRARTTVVEVRGHHVDFERFDVTSAVRAPVDGIALIGSSSRVVGNHVHDIARACRPNGGIVAWTPTYRASGMAIIGNDVRDIGAGPRDGSCRVLHGIYVAVPGVTIANNVVVRAVGDGITSWHAARHLTVANNTVVANGGDGILIGNGDAGQTASGNTRSYVANNIIASNRLDAISEGGRHPVTNAYVANTFWGNGRDMLDQWGDSLESGTMMSDPLFADPASDDFRLQRGSAAIGTGTTSGAPTTDVVGVRRGTSITRGAYQSPVP